MCSLVPTCRGEHPPAEFATDWLTVEPTDISSGPPTASTFIIKNSQCIGPITLETRPLGPVSSGKLWVVSRYRSDDDCDRLQFDIGSSLASLTRFVPGKEPVTSTLRLPVSPSTSLQLSLMQGPTSLKATVNGHDVVLDVPQMNAAPVGFGVSTENVLETLRTFEN